MLIIIHEPIERYQLNISKLCFAVSEMTRWFLNFTTAGFLCGSFGMRNHLLRLLSCRPMSEKSCIFCNIYNGVQESQILYKDSEFVIFSDIRPAAKHHYLVVTKEHIKDAKELTKDHIPLLRKLIEHGKRILEEQGADMNDTRFGFHWPPFHSVSHLHLHAISPATSMSFVSRMIFKPNSLWFVEPEYVMDRISKL